MARAPGRPVAVDRDTLVVATLQIIDRDGVDAVTMRRLATELGVSPMAAYRHVRTKEELLRLAAAAVVSDLPVSALATPWQDVVQRFFVAFHDRLVEHPGVASLFGGQSFLSEPVYAVSEHVFAALLDAGFEPETAVSLFISCASCSIGAATLEAAGARSADGQDTVILLSASKYPAMSKVAQHLPGRESPETHASALAAIIAGYEARLRPAD